jgi:hypothetical protein
MCASSSPTVYLLVLPARMSPTWYVRHRQCTIWVCPLQAIPNYHPPDSSSWDIAPIGRYHDREDTRIGIHTQFRYAAAAEEPGRVGGCTAGPLRPIVLRDRLSSRDGRSSLCCPEGRIARYVLSKLRPTASIDSQILSELWRSGQSSWRPGIAPGLHLHVGAVERTTRDIRAPQRKSVADQPDELTYREQRCYALARHPASGDSRNAPPGCRTDPDTLQRRDHCSYLLAYR